MAEPKLSLPSFARLGNLKDLEMMMKMDGGDEGGSCRRRWRDIQLAPATGPRTDWTGLTNLVVTVEGRTTARAIHHPICPKFNEPCGHGPLELFFLLFS